MSSPFLNTGFNIPSNTDLTMRAASKPDAPVTAQPVADTPIISAPADDKSVPIDTFSKKAAKKAAKENAKKEKRGPIRRFKDFVATTKKLCVTTKEYVKGGFKGALGGAVAGLATIGALTVANKSQHAKLIGAAVGLVGLGIGLFTGSLRANEQRSQIDHTWGNTPISKQH